MKKLFCLLLLIATSSVWAGSDANNFEKLDGNGKSLPADATEWAMVKDKGSGLTWEVKSADDSIHGMDVRYGWSDATETFIAVLNQKKFGGYSDWRMPTEDEIHTIREKKNTPHINSNFFPNTAPAKYWSYYICGDGSFITKKVKFGKERSKEKGTRVRAVRGGETPSQ
jgi:Protein of unknown function (DUF1566)